VVLSPYGSQIILVLSASNILRNSDGVKPCGGDKYRWGIQISRFSTNKSLYLADDTRYRYSYYGRRIGTRMRSIKWCHFQWPWTNSNPALKVTPLFDAKYLTNNYRYRHSMKANRKPHPSFWMAPVLMALSDLKSRFQGHYII